MRELNDKYAFGLTVVGSSSIALAVMTLSGLVSLLAQVLWFSDAGWLALAGGVLLAPALLLALTVALVYTSKVVFLCILPAIGAATVSLVAFPVAVFEIWRQP